MRAADIKAIRLRKAGIGSRLSRVGILALTAALLGTLSKAEGETDGERISGIRDKESASQAPPKRKKENGKRLDKGAKK